MRLKVGKAQVEFNALMLAAVGLIGYLWYTGKLKMPELAPMPDEGGTNDSWNQAPPMPDRGSLSQQDFSQYCTEPKPGEGWVCLPVYINDMPYISPDGGPPPMSWTFPAGFKWYPPGTKLSDIVVLE